jgi:hypothetical protein
MSRLVEARFDATRRRDTARDYTCYLDDAVAASSIV